MNSSFDSLCSDESHPSPVSEDTGIASELEPVSDESEDEDCIDTPASSPDSSMWSTEDEEEEEGDEDNEFDEGDASPSPVSRSQKGYERIRQHLRRDLPAMLYGLGDVRNPYTETVDMLQDLVMEYITDVTAAASKVTRENEPIRVSAVSFAVRKSPSKCARIKDLLKASQELRNARRALRPIR
jgi:transcription initiation factor TFIID subunit 13